MISQSLSRKGGYTAFPRRSSTRMAQIVPFSEARREATSLKLGVPISAESSASRVANCSHEIIPGEKIPEVPSVAPEDNALRPQKPSSWKNCRVNLQDTKDHNGAADIVKSIDYTALSECAVGIDTFFSLWFPSSEEDHAFAIEFHRRVHEEVNGVGSPLDFAVNIEKNREAFLHFSEKDWQGENISHLLKYTWEFTKEGGVQVNFAPATEADEGLTFPMMIELSMLKNEKYFISGSYLMVSSVCKAIS